MGGNPSDFKGPNLPVETVSWDDAQSFIRKANDSGVLPQGWKFALPTEAEIATPCFHGAPMKNVTRFSLSSHGSGDSEIAPPCFHGSHPKERRIAFGHAGCALR
jgi:hypothetical protein